MKRLYKAINEGLYHKLIDFGNNKILKSERTTESLYKFELGDFVYKDKNHRYNNTYGEKVAICVNDDPDDMMYMVLNHPVTNGQYYWACNGKLYNGDFSDDENTTDDGNYNTKYIKRTFSRYFDDTIWDQLKPNEYIPAINELKTIYQNAYAIEKILGEDFLPDESWSSTLCTDENCEKTAFFYDYISGYESTEEKDIAMSSIVLLDINR